MREGHLAPTMMEKCRPRPPVINIVVSAYANHSREFSIGVETIVSAPIKLSHPARKEEEMAFLFKTIICATLLSLAVAEYGVEEEHHEHHQPGFSYAKFSGPVSGPAHEVHIADKHGHGHIIDYVAKPDYQFEYGVEDPKSKVSQNRKEHRHEDELHGEYSVQQPDGKLRVVKYTANKHSGFHAEVLIDGKPLHEEELAKLAHEAQEQVARAHEQQHEEPASYGGHEEQTYGGGEVSYGGEEGGEEYYH